jgi:Kef-type K+ transport system membrane component KefB
MDHRELIVFLLQIAAMLATALVCGHVARRMRLPAVLGELIGGILLGPTVLASVAPRLYETLFPASGSVALARDTIIRLGLLSFLFVAGLDIDVGRIRKLGWSVTWVSLFGVAVPFALGFGLVVGAPGMWTDGGTDTRLLAVFIGTALSISALPVIARILMDLRLTRTRLGTIVLSAAVIDDLVGWSLFALVLAEVSPVVGKARSAGATFLQVALLFLVVLTAGRWLGGRALRWARTLPSWPASFLTVVAVFVLLTAALAELIGVHALLGAFLVGVALAQTSGERDAAHEALHQVSISLFAPIYFVSVGLQANFARSFDPWLVVLLLAVACAGKVGGATLGARLSGTPMREALAIGFGMNARGAMGMILASVALAHRLIDERIFVALIVMAVVTSLVSGPIMHRMMFRSSPLARAWRAKAPLGGSVVDFEGDL